jgi:hypothetical protein
LSDLARPSALALVRIYRFQWLADLLASRAFTPEIC